MSWHTINFSRSSLILITFYLLSLYSLLNATDDDEEWTAVHGNDPLRSGVWDYLMTIRNNTEKMINISIQAHRKIFNLTPNVTSVTFKIKELHWPDNFNFQPIKIDTLIYTAEGRYQFKSPGVPYLFYLTKGQKPDCVYYLLAYEPGNDKNLCLLDHVCDLIMP